jgi:hypothetical protein
MRNSARSGFPLTVSVHHRQLLHTKRKHLQETVSQHTKQVAYISHHETELRSLLYLRRLQLTCNSFTSSILPQSEQWSNVLIEAV